MSSDVILLIPAYNEAESIERVVDELIAHYPEFDYVVVLDGPTDGTDEICKKRGYNALFLAKNLGLRGCFHQGMVYASAEGYPFALQFDGDGQHRPEFIEPILKKAAEGYDIVLGSRFIGDKRPNISFLRGIGSRLISMAIRLKTGVVITDPTCGMRMYSRRIIERFALDDTLSPEPDTVARLIGEGARVAEVSVEVSEREEGSSYLGPLSAISYMYKTLFNIIRL